jgi:hypothetical protein
MLYQNKLLADLFLAFSVAGQLFAIICLVGVLMFFSASLRDDPLPIKADEPQSKAAHNVENPEKLKTENEPMLAKKEEVAPPSSAFDSPNGH